MSKPENKPGLHVDERHSHLAAESQVTNPYVVSRLGDIMMLLV